MDMSSSKFQETVMDRKAWHAAVHEVTKIWTWLSDWTELINIVHWYGTFVTADKLIYMIINYWGSLPLLNISMGLPRTSSMMLGWSGDNGHLSLLLILGEIFVTINYNASYFGGWEDVDALYPVTKFPSIPSLLRVFILNWCLSFSYFFLLHQMVGSGGFSFSGCWYGLLQGLIFEYWIRFIILG